MDFGPDMMGHEPHDALTLGGRETLLRLDQTRSPACRSKAVRRGSA